MHVWAEDGVQRQSPRPGLGTLVLPTPTPQKIKLVCTLVS